MKKLSWHQSSIKEVFSHLNADEAGLTLDEAGARLAKYGPNQLQKKKKEGRLAIFLKQFKSPLIYILLFAAAISFFVGKTTNSLVIFFVLLANSIMGFIQEYRAEKSLAALKKLSSPTSKVIREGHRDIIQTSDKSL